MATWSARSPSGSRSVSGSGWRATTRTPATRSSSSTASTRRRSAATMGGAVAATLLERAADCPTPSGSPTSSASPRRWPRASSRPTAPAARSSGCTAAGPRTPPSSAAELVAARLHRTTDGARGPVRVLPGLAARRRRRSTRVTDGLGEPSGRSRASSSSPTRPTTSPTPSSTRAAALRERGVTPDQVDTVDGGRTGRQPAHHRRADRGQAPRRRPATWRSSAAPYAVTVGLLGGGGLGASLEDYTDALADDPARRDLMDARSTSADDGVHARSSRASSRPWSDRAPARRHRAGGAGAHHARGTGAAAVVRRARHQVPRQRRSRPRRRRGRRSCSAPAATCAEQHDV